MGLGFGQEGARDPVAYARAAVDAECATVASTAHGRNEQLNRSAFALGQFVGAGLLGRYEAEHRLFAASAAGGYVGKDGPAAARATIKSGLDKGEKQPRDLGHVDAPRATAHVLRPKPKLSGVDLPAWTEPDPETGKPKFGSLGRDQPFRFDDEARRHLYVRDGAVVRVKVKNTAGGFLDWYLVRRPSDGAVGWQARKPEGFVPCPYLPPDAPDPFDPERRGEMLVWAEGEKDADACRANGFHAFTFGSAGDVPDVSDLLAGHHVIVAVDNDEAGRKSIPRKVGAALDAGAASVKVVEFADLPEGGDAADFFAKGYGAEGFLNRAERVDPAAWRAEREAEAAAHEGARQDEAAAGANGGAEDDGFGPGAAEARGAGGAKPNGQEKPAVLNDRGVMMGAYRDRLDIALKPEKAAAFPVDALPTLCADMVAAMADLIQAPETLCAHSVLSAAVLATQGLADIHLPNTPRAMPLSLFLLVVAASGERKSSCDALALRAVARLERRLSESYAEDMRVHRADKAAWEGDVSKVKADKTIDADERRRRIRNLREPEEPTAPFIRAEEPNYEGLLNLMVKGRPSLGVFTAEGGQFLGGHGMSDDAKTRTLTGLSKIYDTGAAQRVRAKEIVAIDGRRVSVSLAAQAKIAAALLGDELAQDQGFLGRFLVCYPDSRIGTREVRLAPSDTDLRVEAFTHRVDRLLNLQDGVKAPLRLPTLGLDAEAWEVFRAFSQAIEDNVGEGKLWHPIRAAAQRMAENVGRIAGVLHLFANGGTDRSVDGDTMVSACEVGGFYLKEALRLAGGVMIDAETQAANDLATWIEGRPGDLIAPSHIQRLAPNALRMNAAKTRERIRILCEAGRLEAIGEADIDGKHYREAYRVNRLGRH